jgi:hypothetical protein
MASEEIVYSMKKYQGGIKKKSLPVEKLNRTSFIFFCQ